MKCHVAIEHIGHINNSLPAKENGENEGTLTVLAATCGGSSTALPPISHGGVSHGSQLASRDVRVLPRDHPESGCECHFARDPPEASHPEEVESQHPKQPGYCRLREQLWDGSGALAR